MIKTRKILSLFMVSLFLMFLVSCAKQEFTVNFVSEDGSIIRTEVQEEGTIIDGFIPEVTDEFYFVRWDMNGIQVVFPYTVNGDVNFVARVEKKRAYDLLNESEKEAFDSLIEFIISGSFFNTSAVRLILISERTSNNSTYFSGKFSYAVILEGTNRLGGTIKNNYFIFVNSNNEVSDSFQGTLTTFNSAENINVRKINNAIIEYWEEN